MKAIELNSKNHIKDFKAKVRFKEVPDSYIDSGNVHVTGIKQLLINVVSDLVFQTIAYKSSAVTKFSISVAFFSSPVVTNKHDGVPIIPKDFEIF